jgi:hypothetical protein
VDRVTAERGQLDAVHDLRRGRARLRELARDPPDLHHRERRAVGEHRGHLEQHLQALADRDRGDLPERLGAVPGLEEECPTLDGLAERALQRPRLAGEDERRKLPQAIAHLVDHGGVRPARELQRGERPPGGRRPGLGQGHAASVSGPF